MTDLLKNPIFLDETAAREWLEARVWANGRVCPHCGNADQDKLTKLEGKAHRPGVYQCNEPQCRQQFTVTVNTVFERSKIPLTKWLAALFLMTASKKGISAHQVHRMLGISYKSTWFLMHRLREAMRVGRPAPSLETFEGSSVHKIIEKVPCTLILREGENFKINAILIVGNGNDKITLTAPVISEKDHIKEIERHCP
jgi:transposase-like protein